MQPKSLTYEKSAACAVFSMKLNHADITPASTVRELPSQAVQCSHDSTVVPVQFILNSPKPVN